MDFKKTYRSNWQEGLGIEEVESRSAYETYGEDRIMNHSWGFNICDCREVFEDYVYWDGGRSLFLDYLDLVEKVYVLYIINGVLEPLLFRIMDRSTKPEGSIPMVENDKDRLIGGWKCILEGFSGIDVDGQIKEGISKRDKVGIFQRRTDWQVQYSNFCTRCWRDGVTNVDYGLTFYGRFGFGFVDGSKVLSRRRILFRRF